VSLIFCLFVFGRLNGKREQLPQADQLLWLLVLCSVGYFEVTTPHPDSGGCSRLHTSSHGLFGVWNVSVTLWSIESPDSVTIPCQDHKQYNSTNHHRHQPSPTTSTPPQKKKGEKK
jgi:hypothetical protein